MDIDTVRLNKPQYEIVKNLVVKALREEITHLINKATEEGGNFLHCEFPKVHEIVAYRNKESFGDLDVLIYDAGLIKDRMQFIKNLFDPKEIYHNSNCFSFDYSGFPLRVSDESFQIDLIFVKPGEFETSMTYFSYNDLSNCIGRIFHKFGTKFGHDGLNWIIRDETHVIGEIKLTNNISEICRFGGYDPVRYLQGFDTLQDIFEFIVSSPFYSYDIFDLENRNYKAKVRDAKRKTYTEFLKWAKEQNIEGYEWDKDKSVYMNRIFEFFPHAKEQYKEIIIANQIRKQIKEKFNGQIVMGYTGLEGKELGAFMTMFRQMFDDNEILKFDNGEIKRQILDAYDSYKAS